MGGFYVLGRDMFNGRFSILVGDINGPLSQRKDERVMIRQVKYQHRVIVVESSPVERTMSEVGVSVHVTEQTRRDYVCVYSTFFSYLKASH